MKKRTPRCTFLMILVLVLVPITVRGEFITLASMADTTLFASDGSRSNGGGSVFYTGSNSAISARRGLLQFDIAGSLPTGAIITNVQLTLHVAGFGGSGGASGSDPTTYITSLYAISRSWGEGTPGTGSGATGSGQGFVTPTNGTSATWTHAFYNSQTWNSAGGDFELVPHANSLVSGNIDTAFTWGSTSLMVADVQNWLDSPANNFGWMLIGNETIAQSFRSFYSREASNAALRPSLAITYSSVPEPSSLTLGLLAMIGWRIARRQRDRVRPDKHQAE